MRKHRPLLCWRFPRDLRPGLRQEGAHRPVRIGQPERAAHGDHRRWQRDRLAVTPVKRTLAAACSCDDGLLHQPHLVQAPEGRACRRTTFRLPQLQVTDCKALYNAIWAQNARTWEKPTMVDLRNIQEFVNKKSIRWTPTENMWADGLTKQLKQPSVKLAHMATRSAAFA